MAGLLVVLLQPLPKGLDIGQRIHAESDVVEGGRSTLPAHVGECDLVMLAAHLREKTEFRAVLRTRNHRPPIGYLEPEHGLVKGEHLLEFAYVEHAV